jgi:gas vesicle protein
MRFLFGILLGFAIGFAGAILFAPQASPLRQEKGEPSGDMASEASRKFGRIDQRNGFEGTMKSLRRRVDEALEEAKKAADEAEQQVRKRFEEMVGTKPNGK